MQWHTQAGIITTNLKVEIKFILPKLSAKTILTCNCHVNDFSKGICNMILGRDILTALGLDLELSDYIIETNDGPIKGSTEPMVDLGTYEFKYLNTGNITPE